MLIIGAVASALGIVLGPAHRLVPGRRPPSRPSTIDTLWDVLLIASVPVFVLVETIVLYSVPGSSA